VQGTVTVVWREIVVTGAAGAAGAVVGELEDATTGALAGELEDATTGALAGELEEVTTGALIGAEETAEEAGVVAAGVGMSVMVVGTLVMIPGFWFT
jgi:hypothetical protein